MLKFMKFCENSEIPELFAFWAGLSSVSAALGRNLVLDRGKFKVYPNLYVILVAESGRCRKSTSIGAMEEVLEGIKPPLNLIAQKITPEGLIQSMIKGTEYVENQPMVFNDPGKVCEGFAICDELSMLVNKKSLDAGLGPLLTSFYDCKSEVKYTTKGNGDEVATNTCLGMLGASISEWIRSAFTEESIRGGVAGRMIFVYVTTPPKPVADTRYTAEKRNLLADLQSHISKIRQLKGEVVLTVEAEAWYKTFHEETWPESPLYNNIDLTAYTSRRSGHLFRVDMLLAATDFTLEITVEHLTKADSFLRKIEEKLPDVMNAILKNETGHNKDTILGIVKRHGQIALKDLMKETNNRIDHRTLIDITKTLVMSGDIVNSRDNQGNMAFTTAGMIIKTQTKNVINSLQGIDNSSNFE